MQLATQVILLYLSVALSNGSENGYLPEYDYLKFIDLPPKVSHYNTKPPQKYKTTTPVILKIKDPEINPNNLKYRHRMQTGIIAGLDNMRPIDEKFCLNDILAANYSLSGPIECARTCRKGDRRICYYNFVVENYQINGLACKLCNPGKLNSFCSDCQCVLADGVERSAQIVNRQMPGPSIEVCEGDHVVVDVTNRMSGFDLTIHWHGVFQEGFQYYDGVPFITQCPIEESNTFRYQWGANNPGTHFWHAHIGLEKMDGIFGNLVIRKPPEDDVHSPLYDYDLSTHVLTISDWMHNQALNRFPGRRFKEIGQLPDSILINGKGRCTDPNTGITTNATLAVIDVEPGKRYRIRMVNAFCTVCAGMLTIQDHKLTVIATDGRDITPVTVDSITSFAGERYDFILHTNRSIGSYWIQVRGMGACALNGVQQIAILRYNGASSLPQLQSPSYYTGLPQGVVLNAMNATCEDPSASTVCVSDLDSIEEIDEGILRREPDIKFYLPVGFYQYTLSELFRPNHYDRFMVASGRSTIDAEIDGISFEFPPSPPISQPMDIPPHQYCNRRSNLPEGCKEKCMCTHKLDIPLDAVVEIVLVDELQATNLSHPFHLHGYAFHVMGMGRAIDKDVDSINWRIVEEMDKKNQVNRCFDKPVRKDTVVIPYNGYIVLRFRAINPGYWLFHCHFIYHQMVGMEVLLQVGQQKDLPPVPRGFPKCGPYVPPIGYNVYPPFTKPIKPIKSHKQQS